MIRGENDIQVIGCRFCFYMKRKWITILTIVSVLLGLWGCGFDDVNTFIDAQVAKSQIGEPEAVESISGDKYVYGTLSEEEQLTYDQLLHAILAMDTNVPLTTKSVDEVDKVYNCILADYGELFWISGYSYQTYQRQDRVIGISFTPTYTMTRETREAYQRDIDGVVDEWLMELPDGASDYEKAKFVYETIISRVDYDIESPNNQNIISVFLNHATVCQGYADAAAYLLSRLGIQSSIVTGTANNESHAWNLVRLDGEYYYMDITWGNSRYLNADATEGNMTNYAYLNITGEEIAQTHRSEVVYELPECTAIADNYYNREGLYFAVWDPDEIGAVFADAYYNGADIVSVKFAGNDLYQQAVDYYLTQGRFIDYCRDLRSLAYIESPEMSVLTFMF